MAETPFFFHRGENRLFGVLHEPQQAASTTAFLLSHPFAEEKLWSHRVFVSFARALAERGHLVMRFDYVGAGDSSGKSGDTSLASHLADLSAAYQTLLARHAAIERVGLAGLRFGATVAALFAEGVGSQDSRLRNAPLVLWDPILNGEEYFLELFRSNLTTQMAIYGRVRENRDALRERIYRGGTVNVDGYEISHELFSSCARADLLPIGSKKHAGPTLVMQFVASEQQKPREDLKELAQGYSRGSFVRATEQAFWREIKPFYGRAPNLQETTLKWLEQNDG